MKLTALELVRVIIGLERFEEVDEDFIEGLQVKICEQVEVEPKEMSILDKMLEREAE